MTVQQLQDSISSLELTEWMAYFKVKNEEWEKEHPSKPVDKTPADLSNSLKAALGGYRK